MNPAIVTVDIFVSKVRGTAFSSTQKLNITTEEEIKQDDSRLHQD